jgi:serine phosphatase RsbU (regulator of sigma subunit)
MEVWGGNHACDNGVVMPGLDAWVYSRPYMDQGGGGDVHYVSNCGTGRITRMIVADVSGHGAAVAEIAINLRALMRRYVNYVDQRRFVEAMNREFARLGGAGGFATSVVATYFAPTDYFVLSNAGHPRPLWRRTGKKRWQVLAPAQSDEEAAAAASDGDLINLPLGVVEPTRYDQFGVRLRRDDLVLLYTDSLIEAKSPAGALLGEGGLLDLVRGLDASSPQNLLSDLLAAVERHRGGAPPDDDVTVLLLRHNGSRPRQTKRERLQSVGAFCAMVGARLARRPGALPIPWPEFRLVNLGGALFDRFNRGWGGTRTRDDG